MALAYRVNCSIIGQSRLLLFCTSIVGLNPTQTCACACRALAASSEQFRQETMADAVAFLADDTVPASIIGDVLQTPPSVTSRAAHDASSARCVRRIRGFLLLQPCPIYLSNHFNCNIWCQILLPTCVDRANSKHSTHRYQTPH